MKLNKKTLLKNKNFYSSARVILICAFLFLILAPWAVSTAVGGSPDEPNVLMSTWCGSHTAFPDHFGLRQIRENNLNAGKVKPATKYCKFDPHNYKHQIVPVLVAKPELCYLGAGQDYSAGCQSGTANELTSIFYERATLSSYIKFLRIFVGSDVEASVVKMRLFNSFLAAVLVAVVVSLDRRRLADWFLGWLAVVTPVTTYFVSSVNTSSWTLTGTTCFVFAILTALKNRGNPKVWIPAAVLGLVSVLVTNASRYEGKYVLLLLAAAILVAEFAPERVKLRKRTIIFAGSFLPIIFVVYRYFSNVYGRINVFDDPRVDINDGIVTTANNLLVNNLINLPRFVMGFFGGWGLGWFELEMTHIVWLFALQAFLLTTVFALRKSGATHKIVFATLLTLMCGAILYANQQTFSKVGNVIQPRYFLPFFLGIVIIAAANKKERYPQSLVVTVAILSTIANSIALRDTIRRYTTGQDVFISKSLNNPREWWWNFGPQPETIWLTGTLAFAALFALLIYERRNDIVESDPATSSAI